MHRISERYTLYIFRVATIFDELDQMSKFPGFVADDGNRRPQFEPHRIRGRNKNCLITEKPRSVGSNYTCSSQKSVHWLKFYALYTKIR
jgi:hypothetical protein